MEVVIRPVSDVFLSKVVFPAFQTGVVDAVPAIEMLQRQLNDEETSVLLELVLEHSAPGNSFFSLKDERWDQAVYRILFHEWIADSDGWNISQQYVGYAGRWEETFHLALMLEDLNYPYQDEGRAAAYRRAFWENPKRHFGLATMLCGVWDPVPDFPPDQVLTIDGNGVYDRKAELARADWTWRPVLAVNQWASHLPNVLTRLLDREVKRLFPLEPPERAELRDFWLGRVPARPLLTLTFSGLGPRAVEWISDIGALANLVRQTAAAREGLTCVISRRGSLASESVIDPHR